MVLYFSIQAMELALRYFFQFTNVNNELQYEVKYDINKVD